MIYGDEVFIQALENDDIELLRKVPKSDLHNHLSRAANPTDIEKWLGRRFPQPPKFSSISDMDAWYHENIRLYTSTRDTFDMKIKSAFLEAKRESMEVLCLSIDPENTCYYDNDMQQFIQVIEEYHQEIAPDLILIPEISLVRSAQTESNEAQIAMAEELINLDYFESIDLVGDESVSCQPFADLYHKCREMGMRTKAHIGEFCNASRIKEVLKEIELTDLQHGIAASEDEELMDYLLDWNITLHICPTSNVILGRTPDYTHPQLRKLLDYGVNVTINTDDLLIFRSTISEEYRKLYQSGNFTALELNDLRLQGLRFGIE